MSNYLPMNDPWLQRWNERYSAEEYAFGISPNEYLEKQLAKLQPGAILFPGEGEGRNAVFAATQGWRASAFDISEVGKVKAMRLAEANQVTIDYQVGELEKLEYQPNQFDAVALIYAHFPAEIKHKYHKMLAGYVRSGGIVIFEAFSKRHLDYVLRNPKVGGPKDLASLFSEEEIKADFEDFDIVELVEQEIELHEGAYHDGVGSVLRFVGRKR